MTQSLNDESRKHIEEIAGEALAQLESIAETERGKLYDGRTLGSDALASINAMTSSSAIQRLGKISQANRENHQVLVAEPAIARVVVDDEEGDEKVTCACSTSSTSKAWSSRRCSLSALTSSPLCTRRCSINTCTSASPVRQPTWT